MNKLFIFYHYDSDKRIIILAKTYLEAKEVLFGLNSYADKTYNLVEYKLYELDDKCDEEYPRILSENEYENIKEHIIDSQFNDLHNTHVLTKNIGNEYFMEKNNMLSINELKNNLMTNINIKQQNEDLILQMLDTVGDIWIKAFTYKTNNYYIYGRSRYQVEKLYIKAHIAITKYARNAKIIDKQPCLLINDYLNLTNKDFINYNNMVSFMKKHKISNFPFTTYEGVDTNYNSGMIRKEVKDHSIEYN